MGIRARGNLVERRRAEIHRPVAVLGDGPDGKRSNEPIEGP